MRGKGEGRRARAGGGMVVRGKWVRGRFFSSEVSASLDPAGLCGVLRLSYAEGLFCIGSTMLKGAHTFYQTKKSGLDRELLGLYTLHACYQTHPKWRLKRHL